MVFLRGTDVVILATIIILTTVIITVWHLQPNQTQPTQKEVIKFHRKFELLTTEEKLYLLGVEDNTSSSIMKFDKYLDYVRSHIIKPSDSKPRRPLPVDSGSYNNFLDKLLNGRRKGFFVECGVANGVHSQTQFYEVNRNWTGLLIEANQVFAKELLKLNRKAYFFGGCLTPLRPKHVSFQAAGYQGLSDELKTDEFVAEIKNIGSYEGTYPVQCFPLPHLLAALGVNHVDLFAFDIQGGEPKILAAIDFNALRIDVLSIEVFSYNGEAKEKLRNEMRAFFNKTGLYDEAMTTSMDMIFKRKDLYAKP